MKTPKFWQVKNLASTALLPISLFYAVGFALDSGLTRQQRAPLPVIGVGNITAGGAGKTPTAIALAALLQSSGQVPHIISRGYGGSITATHRVDPSKDTAREVGDEALLLARQAPTWIGRNRLASARAAHKAGATLVIADDALQHHALALDLSVLVVDLLTGFGNGYLLPAGPLRQSLGSAYKVAPTVALAIGMEDPRQLVPQLSVRGELWRGQIEPAADTAFPRGGKFLAFAGIAHPEKFYATLRNLGAEIIETRDFADHHPYGRAEMEQLAARASSLGATLITTEKDAVKIPAEWGIAVATLPVRLALSEPEAILRRLSALQTGA